MKNKNINPEKSDQVYYIRFFMFTLCFVFILLLVYIVGTLLFMSYNNTYNTPINQDNISDAYFQNCELTYENCTQDNCNLYLFCSDQQYDVCRIYDCGDSYGIARKKGNEDFVFTKEIKDTSKKVIEKKSACEGELEVLDYGCVNGKTEIEANVSTEGDCDVSKFMIKFENLGEKPGTFSLQEDGVYAVTSNYCDDINKVTVVGIGGIVIDVEDF